MQSATVHFCLDGRGFDLAGKAGQPVIVMAEDDASRTEQRGLLGNGLGQRALNGLAVDIAAPGHTPGNAILTIERDGLHAVLSGDVIHHPLQVVYPEVSSAFCFDPEQSRQTRRKFVEQYADSNALILPAHFATPTAGRIISSRDGFRFVLRS